jgi:hypothetical protein
MSGDWHLVFCWACWDDLGWFLLACED